MKDNVLFFGWNHPIYGREKTSSEHFGEFVQYLSSLQQNGTIQSFEPVFLNPHGGDINGFFLIKGDGEKLDTLQDSGDWINHIMRANSHLEGFGLIGGVAGELLMQRMELWRKNIPE